MSAKTLTRVQFYRRKWLKDHIFEFATLTLIVLALVGAGISRITMQKDDFLWCFGAAAAVLVAGIFLLRGQAKRFLAEHCSEDGACAESAEAFDAALPGDEPDFDPAEFEAEAEQAAREAEEAGKAAE